MKRYADELATNAGDLATRIEALPKTGARRRLAAIAGPPGSGKSTLAEAVVAELKARGNGATLLAMDGFHIDNAILVPTGWRPRKGAPETFDFGGFKSAVERARTEPVVYLPRFDRTQDFAHAAATMIGPETDIIVAEGNYLLLDEDPWRDLAALWDDRIFLDVAFDELERRLTRRWLRHGFDREGAEAKALGNDIPNARRVTDAVVAPDLTLKQ